MARDYKKYKKEAPAQENGVKRSIDMYNIDSPYRRNTDETRLDNIEINKLVSFRSKTPFDDYIDTEKFETLVRDIEENGVVTPIIVRALQDGKYEVLAGRHRSEAQKRLHRATIPANIYPADTTDEKAMMIHLSTNLMNGRDKISVLETIQAIVAYEATMEKLKGVRSDRQNDGEKIDRYQHLAEVFNLGSRTTALNYLRVGKELPEDILMKVTDLLPLTVAYKLIDKEDAFKEEVYTYIRNGKKLTVKQLETLSAAFKKASGEETEDASQSKNLTITKKEDTNTPALSNKEFDTVLKGQKRRKFCTVKLDKESLPTKFNDLDDTKKVELIISLIDRWNKEEIS